MTTGSSTETNQQNAFLTPTATTTGSSTETNQQNAFLTPTATTTT